MFGPVTMLKEAVEAWIMVLLGTKSLLLRKLAAMGCLPWRIATGPSANSGRQKESETLTWCANDRSMSSKATALTTSQSESANSLPPRMPELYRAQAHARVRALARELTLPS